MSDTSPILPIKDGVKSNLSSLEVQEPDKASYGSQDKSSEIKDDKSKQSGTDSAPKKPPKEFKHHRYATKKTAGQSLMGVSLITSNTAQLKNTLDRGPESDYYVLLLILLCISLFLQVFSGVLLLVIGARESKLKSEATDATKKTERLNDISTILMFVITMTNAALGAFTINLPSVSHLPAVPIECPTDNSSLPIIAL